MFPACNRLQLHAAKNARRFRNRTAPLRVRQGFGGQVGAMTFSGLTLLNFGEQVEEVVFPRVTVDISNFVQL